MAVYEIVLLVVGVTLLGAAVLPRLLSEKPISFPLLYLIFGIVLFSAPIDIPPPDPIAHPRIAEHLTELVIIIALMSAGLKLDRPFDWRSWIPTWRLLGITMPLTILLVALLAWWFLDVHPAIAILVGAVIAPTDPVLASDVQATPPTTHTDADIDPDEQEGSIRFALTSEAGFNDGLAFPFTNLAIVTAATAATGSTGLHLPVIGTIHPIGASSWLMEWFLVDVVYQITVGVVVGITIGYLTAVFIFHHPSSTELARVMEGTEALAATLITYGITELLHGYGFIAVFVGALTLRHFEWKDDYYVALHDFAVVVERLLMAAVLVLFGGALTTGLLAPLNVLQVLLAISVVLIVRPLAGLIGLIGAPDAWHERFVIAAFGIRGIGSFYYLSHGIYEIQKKEFALFATDQLWAFIGAVVLSSMLIHGITSSPVIAALDRWREAHQP
ncbi:cation:proton antiporter [Halocatena salina]|uniref:Cation:proton antiporter n=1 Tax=Halocatena salina TaxID=2934340 RepID=A0A8U0A473_9EURY|nr:cation:proton antiporter [Halocatena salina]UPM42727.1 cation:proton antiporter [Halocatena salina]